MTAAIIGESIGSHQIDRAFQNLVDSYLRDLPDQYSDFGDLQDITESTDFQDAKHNLRKNESDLEFFTINLPNLQRDIIYPKPSPDGLTFEEGKIKVP
jgi:hypothetical protein